LRDILLNGEDIGELAVIALCPEMFPLRHSDELGGNSHPVARFAYRTFDQMAGAKVAADSAQILIVAFDLKRRSAADDTQAPDLCERSGDLFRDAVGEKFLIHIPGKILKRQHCDRNRGRWRANFHGLGRLRPRRSHVALHDDLEESAGLGLRLRIEFGPKDRGERTVELDRGDAPSILCMELHQAACRILMQRLQRQNTRPRFDRVLDLSALDHARHQPGEHVCDLVAAARRLRTAPGFETIVLDGEPRQEFAVIESGDILQFDLRCMTREAPQEQDIDVESGDIECNLFAIRQDVSVLRIAKRLAQPPYGGTQIIEGCLLGGVAPKNGRQFPAWLTAIRAESEIGKQHAFPLAGQCDPASGNLCEFEAAKQA